MAIKLYFLVAASIAAYIVNKINSNSSKPPNSSITQSENGEEEDGFKQTQCEEKQKKHVRDFNCMPEKEEGEIVERTSGVTSISFVEEKNTLKSDKVCREIKFSFLNNKFDMESKSTEMECLQKVVNELEERLVKLEQELFVYYGLEEQEAAIDELKMLLKVKGSEIQMLKKTINSFLVERTQVEEEIAQNVLEKKQLGIAKNKVKELENKIQFSASQTQGRLMIIEEQVSRFEEGDETKIDVEVGKKLKDAKDLKVKAMELRRRNKELQLEKRILVIKLAVTESRITAFSNMTEAKMVSRIVDEANSLRRANEKLLKQLEILKTNDFKAVEEMVYLRWVNACLRYEIQNYQIPSRKSSASEYSNPLNHMSNWGVENSMLEYSGIDRSQQDDIEKFSSSQLSSTEIIKDFDTSTSSSKTTKIGRKTSLIQKLKSWRRSNSDPISVLSPKSSIGNSSGHGGINRRSSMSNVPREASMSSVLRRRRRVSFSDSTTTLETSFMNVCNPVGRVMVDDKYLENKDRNKVAFKPEKLVKEKADASLNSDSTEKIEIGRSLTDIENSSNSTDAYEQRSNDSKITTPSENHVELGQNEGSALMDTRSPYNKSDDSRPQVPHLVSFFFVFLILLTFIYFVLRGVGVR